MANKKKYDDLDIEKPKLDLKKVSSHKKLPDEIPDLLQDINKSDKPAEVLKTDALIREIEIYLSINDLVTAKKAYQELNDTYNRLPHEFKETYYKKIKEIFNKIKSHDSFLYKLKLAFTKKR